MNYTIKISGSGTRQQIYHSILDLAKELRDENSDMTEVEFTDPYNPAIFE